MKKFKVFALILACALVFLFTACDNGETGEQQPQASVTISTPSASLDLYDTLQLSATAENTEESIAWSSSDPSRASVENGLVTALAVGTARITASAGGASAVCTVTITDSQAAPVLSVSETDVQLEVGSSLTVTASVMLKGEQADNVQYSWTGGGQVVSVSPQGGTAVLTGLAPGPAEVYVSATVRGVYVAAKIAVTIRDAGIAFDIANCMPNESGGYSLELYTLAADGFADALTPALTVFENGTELEDPDVSWQSNDSAVVRVEGNESFVAVGEGETQVIGTYKDASVAVSVKVTRTRIGLDGSVTLEARALSPVALPADIQGTVTDATFKGVSVFGSYDAAQKQLTLSSDKFSKDAAHLGEGELVISTDRADYLLDAALYTMIMRTSSDLDAMQGIGEGENGVICDGYYILANDITYTGASFAPLAPEGVVWSKGGGSNGGNDATAGITGGFRGVFDGKGHTITGLKFDASVSTRAYNGMFGVLHREGVVQNVAFEQASVCGALIAYRGSGTVRNVYVQYASVSSDADKHFAGTVFTGSASAGAAIEALFVNCVGTRYVNSGAIVTNQTTVRLIGCGLTTEAVCNGAYVISTSRPLREVVLSGASGADVYAAFASYAECAADATAQSVVAAWDQSIWTTDANGCPVFR